MFGRSWSWTWVPWCPRSPGPSAPRTGSLWVTWRRSLPSAWSTLWASRASGCWGSRPGRRPPSPSRWALTVFKLMMQNCFRKVQNIRKNIYDIIISPIYHVIKAYQQLQCISPSPGGALWADPRVCGDGCYHLLHQHQQPFRHAGRRCVGRFFR